MASCFTSGLGSDLESNLDSGFLSCFASCFASRPGGGGKVPSAGTFSFGLVAAGGLRDRELLLRASKTLFILEATTVRKADQKPSWVLHDDDSSVYASTTHPDELLLLPELFEELLPELPEEELEELPETGDILDGAMTPGGICLPLLTLYQWVSVSSWNLVGVATRSITATATIDL